MKTLAGTIAHRNPQGGARFLRKYGKQPHPQPQIMEAQIHKVVAQHGTDEVLYNLMEEHPDREAIAEMNFVNHDHTAQFREVPKPPKGKHHNCCGSSNFDGEGESFSNCSGCQGTCGAKKQMHFAADGSGATAPIHTGINNTMIIVLALTITLAFVVISTRKTA